MVVAIYKVPMSYVSAILASIPPIFPTSTPPVDPVSAPTILPPTIIVPSLLQVLEQIIVDLSWISTVESLLSDSKILQLSILLLEILKMPILISLILLPSIFLNDLLIVLDPSVLVDTAIILGLSSPGGTPIASHAPLPRTIA